MTPRRLPTLRKHFLDPVGAALDAVGNAIEVFVVVAGAVLCVYSVVHVLAANRALLTTGFAVAFAACFRLLLTRPSRPRRSAAKWGSGLLRAGAALLPTGAGARYAEEWCGEFLDMRSDGASKWSLFAYVIGILGQAVPVLAVTLRLDRERVVE